MNPDKPEFQIKRLEQTDLRLLQKLIRLFQDVFDTENPESAREPYLQGLLENPGFIAYIVVREQDVVGGLTAYELPLYYAERAEIFIYDLAIHPDFQRKGLGRQLFSALKRYGNRHGIQDLFVAAHEEDTEAINFYHSTGGKAENVVHFTYSPND